MFLSMLEPNGPPVSSTAGTIVAVKSAFRASYQIIWAARTSPLKYDAVRVSPLNHVIGPFFMGGARASFGHD
jgi:hypothetical protein